jgi:hypothetical protein
LLAKAGHTVSGIDLSSKRINDISNLNEEKMSSLLGEVVNLEEEK